MDNLDKALTDLFGHAQFRPRQREAVEAVLAGRSVVAVFATGGGKSLCYQLAGSLLPGVTLVFSPLVSLMKDQSETRLARRLKLTTINSHTPAEEAGERLKGLADGTYRMLLVAPERLRRADFVDAVRRLQVSLLVVDEAHCISEWGHDFRPDYRLIRGFRERLGKPPVMALTATATPQVRRDIKAQLGIPDAVEVVGSADRPNIAISVQRLRSERLKLEEVVLALRSTLGMGLRPGGERDPESGSVIIYVPTTRTAERLAEDLTQQLRLKVLPYHAKLPPAMRTRVQEAFMGGQAPVVVATNAFGMGLDKPDVRLVLHYGVPASLEGYYQEIGRAGRDKRPARAILLYTARDVDFRRWLLDEARVRPDDVRQVLDALKAGQPPDLAPPRRPPATAPARLPRLASDRRGGHATRTIDLPLPQEEAAATKLQAILAELEMHGLIERRTRGPASVRIGVTTEEGLEKAARTAGTVLDRLHRQRAAKFRKVEEFLATTGCRREFILRYFGEKPGKRPRPCCDRCARAADSVLVGGLPAATRRVRIGRASAEGEGAARGAGPAARSGVMSVEAALQAGKQRDAAAVPALLGLLEAQEEVAVMAACTALGRIKDARAEAPLRRLLSDPRAQVQRHAAEALGELGRSLDTVLALELMASTQARTPPGRAAALALARVKRRAKTHTSTGNAPTGAAPTEAAGVGPASGSLDPAENGVLAVLAGALGAVTEEDVALHVSGRRAHPSLAPEAFGLLRATSPTAVRRTFTQLRERGLLRGGEARGHAASLTPRGRALLVSHRG